ncbi:hypothetical protein AB6E04_04140 [Vibrio amylolyticus]|uniref:hypothetical protein n=1 Tax=Vibrio amylolyticus TaxID=2847292 RepID=UPI00354E1CCD
MILLVFLEIVFFEEKKHAVSTAIDFLEKVRSRDTPLLFINVVKRKPLDLKYSDKRKPEAMLRVLIKTLLITDWRALCAIAFSFICSLYRESNHSPV